MGRRARVYTSFPKWLEAAGPRSKDACAVCMEEEVDMLILGCQHAFCLDCLSRQLAARWAGPRVTFGFLHCALCRSQLSHIALEPALGELLELRWQIVDVAHQRFCEDDMDSKMRKRLGRTPTEEEVRAQAEEEMVVYMCADCDAPYCAGRVECAAAVEDPAAEDLRCQDCEWRYQQRHNASRGFGHQCRLHGPEAAIFKCDYCCDLAVWDCGEGLGHFCERCHQEAGSGTYYPCPGPDLCSLGIAHPPNEKGNLSFVCGCTRCIEADLGVPEAVDEMPWRRRAMENWRFWGVEDWLAWEEDSFWEAMEADDLNHDEVSAKWQRKQDFRRQPKMRAQNARSPSLSHALIVEERAKAGFRDRQQLKSAARRRTLMRQRQAKV